MMHHDRSSDNIARLQYGRWYYFSLEMSIGQYYWRLHAGRLGADLTYLTLISHVHVDPDL